MIFLVFALLAYWSSAITWSLSLYIRRAGGRPPALPVYPVQALGVSALWLYVPGTTVFKESLRKQKAEEMGLQDGLCKASYELCARLEIAEDSVLDGTTFTKARSLKNAKGGGGRAPPNLLTQRQGDWRFIIC